MSNLYGYNDYNGPSGLLRGHQKSDNNNMNVDDDDSIHNPLQVGSWLEGDSLSPPCGTSISTIHALLEFASVSAKDVLYDFGCGDGRICFEAYAEYNCKQCVGIEIEKDLVDKANSIISKVQENETIASQQSSSIEEYCNNTYCNDEFQELATSIPQARRLWRRGMIQIVQDDLRIVLRKIVDGINGGSNSIAWGSQDEDRILLQRPTVIVLYLLPEAISQIEPNLIQLLKTGNDDSDRRSQQQLRIICIEYGLPNVQPTNTVDVPETVTKIDENHDGQSTTTTTSLISTTSLYQYTSKSLQLGS